MNKYVVVSITACICSFLAVSACYSEDVLSLEPKDNTWQLDVKLLQVGVLETRALKDMHGPDSEDKLKETLGWDDLPEKKRTDADRNKTMHLPKTTAARYMYFVFQLENLTKKPVIDTETKLPKIDEKGNVIYRYVKINTRRVIPDTTYLNVRKTKEKLLTSVNVFFEIDPEGELAADGLWYRRASAIDIRLENKMSPEEKARYNTNLPYLHEFLVKTADYDLVKGSNKLPEILDANQKVRGVAFFAGVPEDTRVAKTIRSPWYAASVCSKVLISIHFSSNPTPAGRGSTSTRETYDCSIQASGPTMYHS